MKEKQRRRRDRERGSGERNDGDMSEEAAVYYWSSKYTYFFETHISQYNEFILKYLQTIISWEDVVKVASNLMLKNWNGNFIE